MNNNQKEALRWLRQAEYDLKSAVYSLGGKFYSSSCFQAQQAGEKAVKAFLVSTGRRAILGHSVAVLLREAAEHNQEFEKIISFGRILDRYYITTRYPDALPEVSPFEAFDVDDATSAVDKASEIIQEVKSMMRI